MKSRVLWVEDGAFSELMPLSSPVYTSGDYDLVIALDASEGFRYLMEKKFDAVIMDIRLPPGRDPYFIERYKNWNASKGSARLGLALLHRILKPSEGQKIPAWITPEHFAVFTVEGNTELEHELKYLGIKVYYQKAETINKLTLIEIIEKVRKVVRQKKEAH